MTLLLYCQCWCSHSLYVVFLSESESEPLALDGVFRGSIPPSPTFKKIIKEILNFKWEYLSLLHKLILCKHLGLECINTNIHFVLTSGKRLCLAMQVKEKRYQNIVIYNFDSNIKWYMHEYSRISRDLQKLLFNFQITM